MKMIGVYYSADGGPERIDSLHYFPRDAYEHLTDLMAADHHLGDDRYTYRLHEAEKDATVTPRAWETAGYAVVCSAVGGPWVVMSNFREEENARKFLNKLSDTNLERFRLARIVVED